MQDIITRSFSININVMRVLGLYPPEKYTCLYKILAYTMYFTFVVTVSLLGIVYIAIDENPDISQLNYTAAYLAQTVSFFSKLLPFIRNGNRIKKCINYFGAPCFQPHKSELKRIIRKCKKICRRNSMAYCIGIAFAAVVWNVKPVFKEGDKLPLDIWLPFDATCHPTVFWITYIFLATAVAYNGFAGSLIDPLIGGLACQAAGQLQVLKYKLQHLKENARTDVYSKIRECVNHHQTILKFFVKEYEECFSWVVFSQFAGSAFAIGFCCLQLSMTTLMSFNSFTSVTYMSLTAGQIYFYCYYATLLFEENSSLRNAIHMSRWYEFDIQSKKALIIIMERSKKPMIITAGGIVDVTLKTFTLILKRSYSLVAVLQNFQ